MKGKLSASQVAVAAIYLLGTDSEFGGGGDKVLEENDSKSGGCGDQIFLGNRK